MKLGLWISNGLYAYNELPQGIVTLWRDMVHIVVYLSWFTFGLWHCFCGLNCSDLCSSTLCALPHHPMLRGILDTLIIQPLASWPFCSPSCSLFWCFSLSKIGDLEGPVSTWKGYNRNIGVQEDKDIAVVVLPGTDWSFQVLTPVPYL